MNLHKSHSQGNTHSHSHSHNFSALAPIARTLFPFDALSNTVLAVTAVTALTQVLMAVSPKLSGDSLAFLVALAEGGMLGTIFLHILPEIDYTIKSGMFILTGFVTFVTIDKMMRICSTGAHPHTHSHGPSKPQPDSAISSSTTARTTSSNKKETSASVKQRYHVNEDEKHTHTHTPKLQEDVAGSTQNNLTPWLNVLADSLHNVTDGISLALAFSNSEVTGFSAFLIMCCHEIPHQFGDFALLINSGTSKNAARKAQLITALGTLLGAFIGNRIGALGNAFEEAVSAGTAGVFLYVATVGVLPHILETEDVSTKEKVQRGIVQLIGIISGASILLLLD